MIDFNQITILNGATGTELIKLGYNGMHEERWILDNKELFLNLQYEYKEAGTMAALTPTFNTNRAKLALTGEEAYVSEFNTKLSELSKSVGFNVLGDIGPTGLFSGRLGKTTMDELYCIYLEQAKALDDAGVDALILETMMTKEDVIAGIKACHDASNLPLIVSCTCDKNGRLMTGTDILEVLEDVIPLGIDAFGLNCSTGPKEMLEQIKRIHKETSLPLIAKPNGGLPVKRGDKVCYDLSPEDFASYGKEFINNGVKLIGGCCGTTPLHIKALANMI